MNEKVAGECERFAVYVNKAVFLFSMEDPWRQNGR